MTEIIIPYKLYTSICEGNYLEKNFPNDDVYSSMCDNYHFPFDEFIVFVQMPPEKLLPESKTDKIPWYCFFVENKEPDKEGLKHDLSMYFFSYAEQKWCGIDYFNNPNSPDGWDYALDTETWYREDGSIKANAEKITVMGINLFRFLEYKAVISRIEIIEANEMTITEKKDKKSKKHKGRKPIKLIHRIIVKKCTEHDNIPREWTRKTESWFVRGHYRHYKNGKAIFIRSYKKGRQGEICESNKYLL